MSESAQRTGMFSALRNATRSTLTLLQTRLALLGVELQEEGHRLLGLLLWGGLAILTLVAGMIFLVVLLTVALWDSHRLLVLGIGTGFFLILGTGALLVFVRLLRRPSALFSASLAELSQDRAALRGQPE